MIECPICPTLDLSNPLKNERIPIQFTEPVQRPDGFYLKIFMYHPSHTVNFLIDDQPDGFYGWVAPLSYENLCLLGEGDFQQGINRAGEEMFNTERRITCGFSANRNLENLIKRFQSQKN